MRPNFSSFHTFFVTLSRYNWASLYVSPFPPQFYLNSETKKRAWSQVKFITHSWRKTKKTEPSLTMNLTLTIVHKTKKTNQHRGWAIKPFETFLLSYVRKLTPWQLYNTMTETAMVYRCSNTFLCNSLSSTIRNPRQTKAPIYDAYFNAMIRANNLTDWMQGWQYGKVLIHLRPIFRLTELAFLRAHWKHWK